MFTVRGDVLTFDIGVSVSPPVNAFWFLAGTNCPKIVVTANHCHVKNKHFLDTIMQSIFAAPEHSKTAHKQSRKSNLNKVVKVRDLD